MTDIQRRLFALRDEKLRDFSAKLTPTVDKEKVIGVRTPQLRALARELAGSEEAERFMGELPHEYMEENGLHGLLIERIKDYAGCIAALNAFLPYVDNWATCDVMSPKVLGRHKEELLEQIKLWLRDDWCYTVRFGMEMLMTWYLDGDFRPEYLELAAGPRSEEYYINMMQAWFFATALAKQYGAALPYLTERRLSPWVHNKTIQKAVESYRISDEQKAYLKTLKIKQK